jgi:hypothetical protein
MEYWHDDRPHCMRHKVDLAKNPMPPRVWMAKP